jgi:EmrB/QacA subfamily drug resistance transporter
MRVTRATGERAVLVVVALGALLAPLNSTMIAVALPRIVDDFDTTIGTAGWLVTTYLLALAVVQPVAGKLGDRYGRRPFVIGGLTAFGLASLGAALAPSLGALIGFRVTQAVAGAVVFPNGAGLIRELVPSERRGGAFGIVGGSIALAAGLGPLIGGALVVAGGWRAIFFVNLPFVAASLALAWKALPRRPVAAPKTAFDWAGSVMLATILSGAALIVVEGRHAHAVLVAGVPLLLLLAAGFVRRELRHADPVLQPRFFAIRPFAAANAGIASSNLAFYTVLLATPILLARRFDWTSLEIGVALALLSAPMVVFSPVGGRLADRLGRRPPSTAGCVVLAAGLLPLAVAPDVSPYALLPCLCLMGAGVGLSTAGLQASAIEALEPEQAGVAAGVFSTSRYIGSFAGSIALARLLDEGQGLAGFHVVFLMAVVGALASVLATLALPGRRAPLAVEPAEASASP